ncbi:hypothetical protein NQ314_009493 [Rhamnusium bicolor]|uniref:PiggyBac transposable element-derived protein domain-containing protein n=1 Tax=Rhamnusium bicolor TaxID=1586634 RepID=A0AAV8XZ15_9CUCU|nr:hypothetical protein NQ314_009493 [Rhamnusium bicolor]
MKEFGKSGQVVTTLMNPYLNKNLTIYLDNWYNSPTLSLLQHDNKTNSCGTIKKNRKFMPKLDEKLKRGEMSFRSSGPALVLKWCDKRDIYMITTLHDYNMSSMNKTDRQTGMQVMKLNCIIDYNQNMGSVDKTDMLISSIESVRKCMKWYKKLFLHFQDMAIINSHSLYNLITKKKSSVADFQLAVARQIFEKYCNMEAAHALPHHAPVEHPLRLVERHFSSRVPKPDGTRRPPVRRCVEHMGKRNYLNRNHLEEYHHLLPQLERDEEKFYSYFRMDKNLTMSTEVNQIIMTPEMLQNLLAGVQQAIQGSTTTTTTTTVSKDGNFSNCTSRFYGKVNSNVEPFIDSIVMYKDCVDISDENALKGLPILLNEPASTWWQGIKSSITTFDEALLALRHAYGYAKPPHQIYRELFSREQNEDEPTDIFISKCRALLSYLPKSPAVHESTQLDMVYDTFKDLIEAARDAEQTFEKKSTTAESNLNLSHSQTRKSRNQCSYCHLKQECRRLARVRSDSSKNLPKDETTANIDRKPVTCYGCGKHGFIRSNCPTCTNQTASIPTAASSVMSAEFLYHAVSLSCNTFRPLVYINVNSHNGLAHINTDARCIVAEVTLTELLLRDNVPYTSQQLLMTLADGKERQVATYIFDVKITPYLLSLSTVLKEAQENHKHSHDSAKKYAYLHRKESSFKSKNSYTSKFAPRRDGPYQISKVVSPSTDQIVSTENPTRELGKYHVSALTPYKGDEDYPDPVPIEDEHDLETINPMLVNVSENIHSFKQPDNTVVPQPSRPRRGKHPPKCLCCYSD